MSEEKRLHYIGHRDDDFFDDAKISVVERYKESEVSGDEWRFNWFIELFRKGKRVAWKTASSLEIAAVDIAHLAQIGFGEMKMFDKRWSFADDDDVRREGYCCQPGCANESTVCFALKRRYDRTCTLSEPNKPQYPGGPIEVREFCERHRRRGDCGLDDADENYEIIWEKPV
jgi:hypothetical protein